MNFRLVYWAINLINLAKGRTDVKDSSYPSRNSLHVI